MAGVGFVVSGCASLWLRAMAFIWWPQSFDAALAEDKFYSMVVLLVVFWTVTVFTFRGIQASVKLSTFSGIFGTIIPGAILIVLGVVYVAMGKPIRMSLNTGFFPDFGNWHSMVLAASIFLFYAGMETQAVHVKNLKNPSRDYPLSILIATIMTVVIFVLGTLAVGVVIPHKTINLAQSLLVAYRDLWGTRCAVARQRHGLYGRHWRAWPSQRRPSGPSTGLLAVGKAGYLPHILQKTNAHGISVPILLLQAIVHISLLDFPCHALGSVGFSNPQPDIEHHVPDHVHGDVRGGHRSALHPAEHTPPVPDPGREFRHVDRWLRRLGGRVDCWRSQFRPAHPDQHRQSGDLCRPPAGRDGHRGRHSLHHLCFPQANLESAIRTSSPSIGRRRVASLSQISKSPRTAPAAPPTLA